MSYNIFDLLCRPAAKKMKMFMESYKKCIQYAYTSAAVRAWLNFRKPYR